MSAQHVLELNGRRYDAMTGQLLSGPAAKSVDGFLTTARVAQPQPRPTAPTAHAPVATPAPVTSVRPKTMDIQRAPVHHATAHKVQHSQTLMRQAVSRPSASLKRQTHAVTHTGALVGKVQFDITPKRSAMVVDGDRLHRAKKIARSGLIRRFAMQAPTTTPRHTAPVYAPRTAAAPTRDASTQDDDIFERALAAASHTNTSVPKKRVSKVHRARQITSIAASFLAVALILGFVAYQNAAVIQLRLAASRAGINATMPAWQPTGFHLGTFAYGPGTVTEKYSNPTSGQQFNIVQTASNWDSSSLLSDFVYPNNASYDTILANGTTIYTYNHKNATWVNGGIWYRLESDGTLSPEQIVNIATSM